MGSHSEVPPETLGIDVSQDGIEVQYNDGRSVFYHGEPVRTEPPHTTAPGKHVHVLVTDESVTSGILTYVNDRMTESDILADSGVGRILLEDGEWTELFPGIEVEASSVRVTIDVDPAVVEGRVFVFEEDQFEERSVELVAAENDE